MKVEDFVNKIYEKSNEYEKLKQQSFQEWQAKNNQQTYELQGSGNKGL